MILSGAAFAGWRLIRKPRRATLALQKKRAQGRQLTGRRPGGSKKIELSVWDPPKQTVPLLGETKLKILDLTAGNRGIWFDKKNPLAVFLDRRAEVEPDIVCDTTRIPDEVGKDFDLIVYDPPHMNCGPNSDMSKTYGYHRTFEILDDICATGKEAHRVSKPGALMALKWNTHDIRLERVFKLLGDWEPLFGQVTKYAHKHKSQTYWVMLRRKD